MFLNGKAPPDHITNNPASELLGAIYNVGCDALDR